MASAADDDRRKSFPCLVADGGGGGGVTGADFSQDKTKEASIYPLGALALTFHRNSSVGKECVLNLRFFDRLPLIIVLINGITPLILLMAFPERVLLTLIQITLHLTWILPTWHK